MKKLISDLAGSKKFAATVLGVVGAVLARIGLSPELAEPVSEIVMGFVGLYVVSQGVADHGKEAAKVKQIPSPELPPEAK